MSDAMEAVRLKSRDNARTPMSWDTSPNNGFTGAGVKPWIRMNDEYPDVNVEKQLKDPDSVLNYFIKLTHTRKQHPLMVRSLPFASVQEKPDSLTPLQAYGTYVPVNPTDPQIFSFLRVQGVWRSLIFGNWSPEERVIDLPEEINTDLAVLLVANYPVETDPLSNKVKLRPYEARIYSLRK